MNFEKRRFALASMSPLILVLTVLLLGIPVLMAILGLSGLGKRPLLAVATLVAGIYLLVWGYFRPTSFEVSADGLRIVWPWRSREIAADDILSAKVVSAREIGCGARVGAGGLFGAFGILLRWRRPSLDMYISRVDGLILVERHAHRPLLITPERPEEFLKTLQSVIPSD